MAQVLGGKNVYYFLTPLERGRLQVLPLGYNVHEKKWFDVPGSGVRHFVDQADAALDWRHSAFTFNTSCHSCHVSQLSRNYDAQTDSYHTTWASRGSTARPATARWPNTSACAAESASPGETPQDLKIISFKNFSKEQLNSSVRPSPRENVAGEHELRSRRVLLRSFRPGHPGKPRLLSRRPRPGRELHVHFLASESLRAIRPPGLLAVPHLQRAFQVQRRRFQPRLAPCHAEKVANLTAHSFHKAGSSGNQCVACHMPTTGFAAMMRTDHSIARPCRPRRSPSSRPTLAICAMRIRTRAGRTRPSANGGGEITIAALDSRD